MWWQDDDNHRVREQILAVETALGRNPDFRTLLYGVGSTAVFGPPRRLVLVLDVSLAPDAWTLVRNQRFEAIQAVLRGPTEGSDSPPPIQLLAQAEFLALRADRTLRVYDVIINNLSLQHTDLEGAVVVFSRPPVGTSIANGPGIDIGAKRATMGFGITLDDTRTCITTAGHAAKAGTAAIDLSGHTIGAIAFANDETDNGDGIDIGLINAPLPIDWVRVTFFRRAEYPDPSVPCIALGGVSRQIDGVIAGELTALAGRKNCYMATGIFSGFHRHGDSGAIVQHWPSEKIVGHIVGGFGYRDSNGLFQFGAVQDARTVCTFLQVNVFKSVSIDRISGKKW